MGITAPHVLPRDVVIIPVTDLEAEVRAKLDCDDDAYAITRPGSRTPAKIVDAQAGQLLKYFTSAKKIADAVIEFSEVHGAEPESVLTDAFPMLQRFVNSGLLVEDGSERASAILASRAVGTCIGDWEVVRNVQVLEDVELYQVRRGNGTIGALKLARSDTDDVRGALQREAEILQYLDGRIAPELLEHRDVGSCAYLVTRWCAGVNASVVAAEHRSTAGWLAKTRLLRLCASIADAYAELHTLRVVHGDVHERNILVDAAGAVRILDFGLSRKLGEDRSFVPRGGVGIYFEPEYVQRNGHGAPPATVLGEQYSLAAMLYSLFTGTTYLSFSLDREAAMTQIASDAPRSFASVDVTAFPELEGVLAKALAKSPADRYESVARFAHEVRRVLAAVQSPSAFASGVQSRTSTSVADALLGRFQMDGSALSSGLHRAPTANVNFGAAGIAHALYRVALTREDPHTLSIADIWATRAVHDLGTRRGCYNAAFGLTRQTVGPTSLYHTASGVHVVRTQIACAMGDFVTARDAIDEFIDASRRHTSNIDLTLGKAGVLLGCALLCEILPQNQVVERGPLLKSGDRIANQLWRKVKGYPSIGRKRSPLNLGVAHGWAGVLYAMLQWRAVTKRDTEDAVRGRLQQLADCAEPDGRGLRWPWFIDSQGGIHEKGYMAGWCNGSAGFVHLWYAAHRALDDPTFRDLALGAAWNVWEEDDRSTLDLCCGLAGRAYALLTAYRMTGDPDWLERARSLTREATEALAGDDVHNPEAHLSLYKSGLGVAVLGVEIEQPDGARMPLFESAE